VKIGWSLQVATVSAGQRDNEQRQRYIDALDKWVIDPCQLLFIDETHKDRNAARRRRPHWSLRNQTPGVSATFLGSHSKRYSLLAACDMEGFILEVCSIVIRDEPDGGTVELERFETWVDDHLVNVLGDYAKGEPRSVVVLDNASVHHSDYVVHAIESAGAEVIYAAPYSPYLNPIALMFGQYNATPLSFIYATSSCLRALRNELLSASSPSP
jgi:hypothetical protein